jgi:GNAT superfamily N-acetyltransferase
MPQSIKIEPLSRGHKCASFFCGQPQVDLFLAKQAKAAQSSRRSRVWVVADGQKRIQSFVSLHFRNLSILENEEPYPMAWIGFLGTDRGSQGQGMGRSIFRHALKEIDMAGRIMPIASVALQMSPLRGKEAGLRRFYTDFGFVDFPGWSNHMLMPYSTLASV